MPKNVDWDTFQKEHEQKVEIMLECDKMVKAHGLRAMAKLPWNSLWGKLGQDPNLRHSIIVDDPNTYAKIKEREYNGEITVNQIQPISDDK